jgi:exosortase
MTELQAPDMGQVSIEENVPAKAKERIDWGAVGKTIVSSKYFLPVVILLAGITAVFWPLLSSLYGLWTGKDGYYTHGFLVPLITGYLIYRAWPTLKDTPIKPQVWAIFLIIPILWVAYAARLAEMKFVLSIGFISTLLLGILFVFGWKWLAKLTLPVMYLIFALPLWSGIVNGYTNPLQTLSTKVAYNLLKLFGDPYLANSTDILMGNFWLNVGVPCSGLKLVIAITAFTCFFVMIGGLNIKGILAMFIAIVPLCLFINGLRIALIGIVGAQYGDQAGMTFHDYSGYLTLIVCFFILFKFARLLGWKD